VTVLVTGACGFVMSSVLQRLLESDAQTDGIAVDLTAPDELVNAFFGQLLPRLRFFQGDVTDPEFIDRLPLDDVTHVIHGASVTHVAGGEQADPARFFEVNVVGTLCLLQRLREVSSLQRVIYVSSGAVYGDPTDASPEGPQPESGPFNPRQMYAISKYAGEQAARRCAELHDLDVRHVRFSDVFGPMERPTPARLQMSLPHRLVQAAIMLRRPRITRRTLGAGGDYLHAVDVADAVATLLYHPHLAYNEYNIALGRWVTVETLLEELRSVAPEFGYDVVDSGEVDIDMDPSHRRARWNAYAIDRIGDIGWQPRPLDVQLRSYLDWARMHQAMQASKGHPAPFSA
jgi:nucleoside-diphosphate-sugar epimerase